MINHYPVLISVNLLKKKNLNNVSHKDKNNNKNLSEKELLNESLIKNEGANNGDIEQDNIFDRASNGEKKLLQGSNSLNENKLLADQNVDSFQNFKSSTGLDSSLPANKHKTAKKPLNPSNKKKGNKVKAPTKKKKEHAVDPNFKNDLDMKNIPDPATYRHKSERSYSDSELLPQQKKQSNKDKKQKYPNTFSKKNIKNTNPQN